MKLKTITLIAAGAQTATKGEATIRTSQQQGDTRMTHATTLNTYDTVASLLVKC